MTKFEANLFDFHGGYLTYGGKFVARFKHSGSPISPAKFKRELIKNHTVEAYFEATEHYNTNPDGTPLGFMRVHSSEWYLTETNKWRAKNGLVAKYTV